MESLVSSVLWIKGMARPTFGDVCLFVVHMRNLWESSGQDFEILERQIRWVQLHFQGHEQVSLGAIVTSD